MGGDALEHASQGQQSGYAAGVVVRSGGASAGVVMSADDDPFGGFAGENGADVDEGALVRRERLVCDRSSRFRQGPGDVLDRPGLVLFITRRARVAGFGQVEDVLFQFLLQPRADGRGGSAAGRGGGAVGNDAARGDGEDGQGGKQREINPELHAPFISIYVWRDNFNVRGLIWSIPACFSQQIINRRFLPVRRQEG